MPTLQEKQSTFARLMVELIEQAYREGFKITLGEAYRSPEEAKRLAKAGKGIENSLHTQRLAIDLNLFDKKGTYLKDSKSYEWLGMYWESLSTPGLTCCWGGRFKKPDGNHFSIEHNGIK